MLPKINAGIGQKSGRFNPRGELLFEWVMCATKKTKEMGPTAMKTFTNSINKFIASEDGPTAVEYAVMLALIVVVCLTAIQAVGTNANAKFNTVKNALT